jgi:hypothetical protein
MNKHKLQRRKNRAYMKVGIAGIVAVALAIVIVNGQQPVRDPAEPLSLSELQRIQRGFPFFFSEEEAKPFPRTLAANLFNGFARHAYHVAEEMPGVLSQQPCFCECRSSGHRSLLFCYTSGHAAGCDICIRETYFAERMTNEGKTPSEIRDAIIRGAWRRQRLE